MPNMFKRLAENINKIRTIPRPDPEKTLSFTNKNTSLTNFIVIFNKVS